jgi:predicted nuclease of predicted toxin-antitoxin system
MGISASIAAWLKAQGHDAVHLNDENLNSLPDDIIIEKAINEHRIILTSDMDFGQLLALNKSQQVSLIQFRISNFKPAVVKNKLELVFDKFHNQLDGDFIITVEDERIRFRNLPI